MCLLVPALLFYYNTSETHNDQYYNTIAIYNILITAIAIGTTENTRSNQEAY